MNGIPILNITTEKMVAGNFLDNIGNDVDLSKLKINKYRKGEDEFNFDGEYIPILLFFKEVYFNPAAYDITKSIVLNIWDKFYGKGKIKKDTGIRIECETADGKRLQIEFDGKINRKTIDNAVNKAFEFLKEEKRPYFSNSDLVTDADFMPTVVAKYNEATNSWELVNFAQIRKKWDDQMRDIQNQFNG